MLVLFGCAACAGPPAREGPGAEPAHREAAARIAANRETVCRVERPRDGRAPRRVCRHWIERRTAPTALVDDPRLEVR